MPNIRAGISRRFCLPEISTRLNLPLPQKLDALFGVNEQHALVYLYGTDNESPDHMIHALGSILSGPTIKDGVIYFGSLDGHLYSVGLPQRSTLRNAARQGRHRKRDGPDRPADHRIHWHPTCVQTSKSGQCLCAPGVRHRVPCRRDAT